MNVTIFSANITKELILDLDKYNSQYAPINLRRFYDSHDRFLIIDDYGHYKGAQRAVDEYFSKDKPWMHYVDYSCRLIIKR